MYHYRLVVTRVEPNPKAAERSYGPGGYGIEPATIDTEVLTVVLTEGEYRATKAAVLEFTDPQVYPDRPGRL